MRACLLVFVDGFVLGVLLMILISIIAFITSALITTESMDLTRLSRRRENKTRPIQQHDTKAKQQNRSKMKKRNSKA